MRSSIIFAVAAAFAPVLAGQSSVVPIQQIGDGQIQNPATPPAPAPTSYPAPPATSAATSKAYPSSAPPAPPVVKPSGGGIPPSYGNVTSTAKVSNTVTATVVKPSKPVGPTSASSAASAASPSGSKPAVQSGSANALAGSTAGLGFAAFLALLLG